MYLAPLNYDRFFQRIFSDSVTAKRFFEDILDVTITDFQPLPRKNKMTDDAAFVEFDYRCRIDGKYNILDMQQWYKIDVVKRFYLYSCNNTSLQLETMKSVTVPLPDGQMYKTKDYQQLEPTITLIWMADDTLGFKEDFMAYSMFPENMRDFLHDDTFWATKTKKELLARRQKVLDFMKNTHKNLDFLSQNRLIFLFQPNIIRNKKLTKYFEWFEFAGKTKNKKNVAADFKKYFKDPIFSTMIEKLRTNVLNNDDFQYIDDYESYMIGVENYNEKIRNEALREANISIKEVREQAQREREQAQREREQAQMQKKHTVWNMRKRGFSADAIANITEIDIEEVNAFWDAFDAARE